MATTHLGSSILRLTKHMIWIWGLLGSCVYAVGFIWFWKHVVIEYRYNGSEKTI